MSQNETENLAVLGAGPIGLEAALYGRFLGFDVDVFERGEVCQHVRDWGHVELFTPFNMNCSPLGIAALEAQDPNWSPLASDALHSGHQWIDSYLGPLAGSDLLAGRIHTGAEVLGVARSGQLKSENVGQPARSASPFQLLLRKDAKESYRTYDWVIDATGTFSSPNFIGPGGLPALGELEWRKQHGWSSDKKIRPHNRAGERERHAGAPAAEEIGTHPTHPKLCYGIPRLDGAALDEKRILVLGQGYSAATNIAQLVKLIDAGTNCQVTWLTRTKNEAVGPIQPIDSDTLPARAQLTAFANGATTQREEIQWVHGEVVQLRRDGGEIEVTWSGSDSDSEVSERFDLVLANVGFRGDYSLLDELQVHRCYATDGPIKFAASLMEQAESDCLNAATGPTSLLATTEPGLFVLGSKLYGRDSRFLFQTGLNQIRDVFRLIVGRENLDLYSTMQDSMAAAAAAT